MVCENTKALLPRLVRGELAGEEHGRVETHVSACGDCGAEVALLEQLWATKPRPPEALADEIKEALARDRPRPRRSQGWRLPAAAAAVLALGTAVLWQQSTQTQPSQLAQESFLMVWPGDGAFVAGEPMFADLSEDELAILLEELGG